VLLGDGARRIAEDVIAWVVVITGASRGIGAQRSKA
jgi:NADP-dependent 3-hydroxy acid dehydrogenase YdfG